MALKVRIKEEVIKTTTNEIKSYFSKQIMAMSWKALMKYIFGKSENDRLMSRRKRPH